MPPESRRQVLLLGTCAALMLVPVTLPVPVLRDLVQARFGISDFAASWFMSINMIGALIAAPIVGVLADRFGGAKPLIVVGLLIDALCFWG
ncbi:MAG: MFS transporter, partial [Planctomycetes bacterium]|nr:MFS transporter [Planctomycetota bacterium]